MSGNDAIIILATRNQGKIQEMARLLAAVRPDIKVQGLDRFPQIGDIPETGSSFEENARIKAMAVARGTGYVAIADDSGLEVPALDGEPGVYSARYAGKDATDQENNAKLLRRMRHLSGNDRAARFICVLVAHAPGGASLMVRGEWEGMVLTQPKGTKGFGYDPVFYDPELKLTAAQMDPVQKNQRSHRGKALEQLLKKWDAFMYQINL